MEGAAPSAANVNPASGDAPSVLFRIGNVAQELFGIPSAEAAGANRLEIELYNAAHEIMRQKSELIVDIFKGVLDKVGGVCVKHYGHGYQILKLALGSEGVVKNLRSA